MPLVLADIGRELIIMKIGGNAETKQHLTNLGFNVGGFVTVVHEMAGSVIVKVKDARIAISKEMAQKIIVREGNHENAQAG